MNENENTKDIKGTTIEIRKDSVKFIPEEKTDPWWRYHLDRKKDAIIPPQMGIDMQHIVSNLSKLNGEGEVFGKFRFIITSLPANPKSSRTSRQEYEKRLIARLGESEEKFKEFKGKKVMLYVAIYLRKERYEKGNDVPNFLKPICDALIPFIGDDENIVTIIAEKKMLDNFPEADMDFLEQVFIVVADPLAKSDILKC